MAAIVRMVLLVRKLGRLGLPAGLHDYSHSLVEILSPPSVPLWGRQEVVVSAKALEELAMRCEVGVAHFHWRRCWSQGAIACWRIARRVEQSFVWPSRSS